MIKRVVILLSALFLAGEWTMAKTETKTGDLKGKTLATATFAGGCFWCMQPPYDKLKGIKSVTVGYTGGHKANPTYEEVCTGSTGHAEAVQIVYDPAQLTYPQLLDVFWKNIDPTTLDAQFADHGTQYRSAIFYHNEEQKRQAEISKEKIQKSGKFSKPIVTEIAAASTFYPAEDYHQGYYQKCPLRYQAYHAGSGRESFIEKLWGHDK
jgi:methionine-S-sulfoxide reductase